MKALSVWYRAFILKSIKKIYCLMIQEIQLKFGSVPNQPPVDIKVETVTIFVGPNNSGKSRALQEIKHLCTEGIPSPSDVIIEKLIFSGILPEEISSVKEQLIVEDFENFRAPHPGYVYVGDASKRMQAPEQSLELALQNPVQNARDFCQWYLAFQTLFLDGESRISLTHRQQASDLQALPKHALDLCTGQKINGTLKVLTLLMLS